MICVSQKCKFDVQVKTGNLKTQRPGSPDDREHRITLPPVQYQALSAQRLEISSRVLAHIVWDNDNCRLIILG